MQHEEHSSPAGKRFGSNTNGLGIFIVAIVAVFLSLFCWKYWKNGSKEIEHYRLNSVTASPAEGHHGHDEPPVDAEKAAATTEHSETQEKTDTSHAGAAEATHDSESTNH